MDLRYLTFFGDFIWILFPLIVIFALVNAMGGTKGGQGGRGRAEGFGGTWLDRMDSTRRYPDNAARDMDPDRNLDSRDLMDSPQVNGEGVREQKGAGSLASYLQDLMETRTAEPPGERPSEARVRIEPLPTMKKAQADQQAERDIEREKRYAYDGQPSQSKSSTRDQAEREKRYSYDRQGYESKASNRANPPEAVLQKISTAVAMSSTVPKRKEGFLGGMGSEFLDSADQYLRMGDYHLTHKPGGLYSYPEKVSALGKARPDAVRDERRKAEDERRKAEDEEGMGRGR